MIGVVGRVRVLRVVTRLNVGGHARTIHELWRGLDPERYEQRILTGQVGPDEIDFLRDHAPEMSVVHLPDLRRAINPIVDARALLGIRREIRTFRPDIVHTHLSKAGTLGRLARASARSSSRTVHTFHGLVLDGILSQWGTRAATVVERALGRRTDRLVTEGAAVRDRLLQLGIGRPEQFTVLAPGVRLRPLPDRAAARAVLGLGRDELVVTMAGRFVAEKRPDRFIEVAGRCTADFPSVRFLLVGGGPLEAEVRRMASRVPSVELLGWRSDVETVLAASDIAVLTSDSEGMPLVLIEAGLAGLPAVTTDVGSASEIVVDGESGYVCALSVEALERGLRSLLTDRTRREAMGARARVICTNRFSAARLVADVDRIYTSVLGASITPGSTE